MGQSYSRVTDHRLFEHLIHIWKRVATVKLSRKWEFQLYWQEKTYPFNLLGPVPNHMSAFYTNKTEKFGHLFVGRDHVNSQRTRNQQNRGMNWANEREKEHENFWKTACKPSQISVTAAIPQSLAKYIMPCGRIWYKICHAYLNEVVFILFSTNAINLVRLLYKRSYLSEFPPRCPWIYCFEI